MTRGIVRKRGKPSEESLAQYNQFCKSIKEGNILYNRNNSSTIGELFLVAAKITVILNNIETYTVLLIGVREVGGKLVLNNQRIDLTPQKEFISSMLRPVGYCNYDYVSEITEYKLYRGSIAAYRDTDVKKFYSNSFKTQSRRYGDDGYPLVKPLINKQ